MLLGSLDLNVNVMNAPGSRGPLRELRHDHRHIAEVIQLTKKSQDHTYLAPPGIQHSFGMRVSLYFHSCSIAP